MTLDSDIQHSDIQHSDIQQSDIQQSEIQHSENQHGAAASTSVPAQATGNPHVDGVLQTLDQLAGLPVDQHVAVFEAAHAGLRQALSDPMPDQD